MLLAVMAPAFLAFTLAFTGTLSPFTGWKRWLFFIEPLLVLIALVSDPRLSLFRMNPVLQAAGSFDIVAFIRGPAWYFHTIYTYLMMLAGTVWMIRHLLRSPRQIMSRNLVLLGGLLLPWLFHVLHALQIIQFTYDPSVFTLTISSAAFMWAVSRLGLD